MDAVVRDGYDMAVIAPSVARVAEQMDLDATWLNDAVGMFTPLDEDEAPFEISGSYPSGGQPGLRTFVARPHYRLAMKLQALRTLDRGDRDMNDARALAAHLGLDAVEDLSRLYRSIYDEEPPAEALVRFPSVLVGPQ